VEAESLGILEEPIKNHGYAGSNSLFMDMHFAMTSSEMQGIYIIYIFKKL